MADTVIYKNYKKHINSIISLLLKQVKNLVCVNRLFVIFSPFLYVSHDDWTEHSGTSVSELMFMIHMKTYPFIQLSKFQHINSTFWRRAAYYRCRPNGL